MSNRVTIPMVPPLLQAPAAAVLWRETFDQLDAHHWREIEVHGQSDYGVVDLEGRRCLRAESRGGASLLVSSLRFDPDNYPWLSWAWRVDQLIEHEALHDQGGSDAAARVYVYFDTKGLLWKRHNIDYVWSATLPVGTMLSSAFSANSKIIVVESGSAHLGQWQMVARDLRDDYTRSFGEDPPDALAIGIMTDADNTHGQALAYYDDLEVSRAGPGASPAIERGE